MPKEPLSQVVQPLDVGNTCTCFGQWYCTKTVIIDLAHHADEWVWGVNAPRNSGFWAAVENHGKLTWVGNK